MIVIRKNAEQNTVTIDGEVIDMTKMGKRGKKWVAKRVMDKARDKYCWEE